MALGGPIDPGVRGPGVMGPSILGRFALGVERSSVVRLTCVFIGGTTLPFGGAFGAGGVWPTVTGLATGLGGTEVFIAAKRPATTQRVHSSQETKNVDQASVNYHQISCSTEDNVTEYPGRVRQKDSW